ncbi:MAG TPA: SDR family NAD(P)-dependent oxidoreductase [Tepidisphaeraceae bacterium]
MQPLSFDISGRVALLTGAGRGIGLAIAQALAGAGAAVAIQDVDLAIAEAEAEKINQAGRRAIALGGDVADLSLPARLVHDVVTQLGGLHILINNASIQKPQPWLTLEPPQIERELRADLITPLLLCQRAAPIFQRQRWGRIINIGSIQQRGGNPNMLPYSLSKLALDGLTKALARDLAKDNITVNLLAPGWFNTYRNRGDFESEQDLIDKGKHVPLGRIGDPADCAGAALLLCSEAGSYITGQSIFIDGGMSAR